MLKLIEVEGDSMRPAFRNGEFCIMDSSKKAIKAIKDGDVIVFHLKKDQKSWYTENDFAIKRIVSIKADEKSKRRKLIWVQGDNKNHSEDSRKYGYISTKQVIGVVVKNPHITNIIEATKYLFNLLYSRWNV